MAREFMSAEHLVSFLPVFGTWLVAGLVTGWLASALSSASTSRR